MGASKQQDFLAFNVSQAFFITIDIQTTDIMLKHYKYSPEQTSFQCC